MLQFNFFFLGGGGGGAPGLSLHHASFLVNRPETQREVKQRATCASLVHVQRLAE